MKNCRTVLLILISFSCLISVVAAQDRAAPTDPSDLSLEANLDQLMTSVYCHCGCVRETIKHCVCGVAQGIETDFRNRLSAGETIQQIRDDYLARYGTQYSALMPVKGFNIVAYAMPAIIIVLMGVIVFLVLRSKRSAALAKAPASTEPQESTSTDQYEQIEQELEHYKQQK